MDRMLVDVALTAIIALLLFLLLQLSPCFPPLFCSVWSRSWRRPTPCLCCVMRAAAGASPKVDASVCSWCGSCVTKGRRRLLLATLKFNGGCKGREFPQGRASPKGHHQKVDAAGSTGALKGVVMLID